MSADPRELLAKATRPDPAVASFKLLGRLLDAIDDPTALQALVTLEHYCSMQETEHAALLDRVEKLEAASRQFLGARFAGPEQENLRRVLSRVEKETGPE